MRLCLAGFLPLFFASAAQAQDQAAQPSTPQECAVLEAVGEAVMHWREHRTDELMSRDSAGTDCGWSSNGVLFPGVAPERTGPYFPGLHFWFSRPAYSVEVAKVRYLLAGNASAQRYFRASYDCIVTRQGADWQADCHMGAITQATRKHTA